VAPLMRTLVFKIHNPSREKRVTLHRALRAYTNAAAAVLDGVARDWETVREEAEHNGALRTWRLQQVLTRRYRQRTMPYPLHGSLRESLFADLAAQLSGYDALCRRWQATRARVRARIADEGWSLAPLDPRAEAALAALGRPPSWPTTPRTRPDYDAFDAVLTELATARPDLDDVPAPYQPLIPQRLVALLEAEPSRGPTTPRLAQRLRSAITTGTRPLYFVHPDGAVQQRGFALLRTEKDSRYYALLYILPRHDTRAAPLVAPRERRGAWIAVHPSRTVVESTSYPSCAIAVALECGAWHVKTALQPALERPEMVRVARLLHRPERRTAGGRRPEQFFLALTFAFEYSERHAIRAYMGVTLDDENRIAWSVRDVQLGQELLQGSDDALYGLHNQWRREWRLQKQAGDRPSRAPRVQAAQVKEAVHVVCNRLVAIASAHDAQIGLHDVTYLRERRVLLPRDARGKRAARTQAWHAAASDRQYRRATLVVSKVRAVLGYKLPPVGLPPPLLLSDISTRDCAACGQRGTAWDLCSLCGATLDIHNAARVTAARVPTALERIRLARVRRARDQGHVEAEQDDVVGDRL